MTAGSGSAPNLPASERFAIVSTPFSPLASHRPPPLSCGLGLHLVQIMCPPTDGGQSASAGRAAQGILPPGGGWGRPRALQPEQGDTGRPGRFIFWRRGCLSLEQRSNPGPSVLSRATRGDPGSMKAASPLPREGG